LAIANSIRHTVQPPITYSIYQALSPYNIQLQ